MLDRAWYDALVDDDGSGQTGSFWDKAAIDGLLDAIDALRLDQLAAPTDVTTLNATTSAHGLLPKLPGGTTTFLRADGTFATPAAGTPAAHATTHEPGGSDVMAVDAAASTGSLRTLGITATSAAAGNDARLSDARTPTAHATSHQSGGGDAVKLDDLAAPDDNTDLNASTSAHGLLSKLPGGSTNFLRADGTWAAPPGGGGSADGAGVRQTFRGLHLRTHPDADVAASKVMLVHADEIVLSDGTRITPSDGLVADITASGIGGLRAGQSEGASTWYKVLIGTGGSGTGLWLERAKDYYADQQQANSDGGFRLRKATTHTKGAQSFQVATAGVLPFVDVLLLKIGTPTGSMWWTIEADASGAPSGTPIATSIKISQSPIATALAQWIRLPFRAPPTLATGTTYWLVMQGDNTLSDANNVTWRVDFGVPYANGQFKTLNSGVWDTTTLGAADAGFRIYITRNDNAPAPPTGYDTGYAQIGWVRNDGSSNFRPFHSLDRYVRDIGSSTHTGPITSAVALLQDLSALVPPLPVLQEYGAYNDTSGQNVFVGGIDAYANPNGYNFGGIGVTNPSSGNTMIIFAGQILLEYQCHYVMVQGGAGYPYVFGWRW